MINKNMEEKKSTEMDKNTEKPDDKAGFYVRGHIKIHDPESGEILIDKPNAIHYENMSEAMAYSLANKGENFIYQMAFGNGGTAIDTTGIITYLPTNTNVQNADLYNTQYSKIVDDNSTLNVDPARNKITVSHVPGTVYTDILITCLLDYAEPSGQSAFDNATDPNSQFTFDELGLKSTNGKLLTHVIFHPVQKSLNRLIQIDYTVRIQTLTNLSNNG